MGQGRGVKWCVCALVCVCVMKKKKQCLGVFRVCQCQYLSESEPVEMPRREGRTQGDFEVTIETISLISIGTLASRVES